MGRNSGRQWGIPMAASGENYMATVKAAGSMELESWGEVVGDFVRVIARHL
jgi:hypothetical protein